jgi:flagellar motor switch protein FliM
MGEQATRGSSAVAALFDGGIGREVTDPLGLFEREPSHEPGRRIKPYDFRHPEKLSKEQIRGLQIIQQGVAGALGQSFSARLRTSVEAKLSALERSNYDEYLQQIGLSSVIVFIDMAPLQGYAVAAFGLDVAFSILDRLLGGRGMLDTSVVLRDLTDIELALVRHVGSDIANSLVEPWARVAELTPDVTEIAVGPQVVHVIPPSEFVISAWYDVRLGDQTGGISVCFPLGVLEQILPRLSGHSLIESRPRLNEQPDFKVRPDQLAPAKVELRALLGSAEVSAVELGTLAEGDVLILDTMVDDPMRLFVGNVERFAGSPGLKGKKLGLQLTGLVNHDGVVTPFEGNEE